jgi:hypothetical protein
MELTMAPVRELRDALDAADIRNEEDPAALVPPGVLVQVTGFSQVTLDGLQVTTRLLCVVLERDHERASDELVTLVNRVLTVVDPDGPITAAGVVLGQDPAPLPALSIPCNLTT